MKRRIRSAIRILKQHHISWQVMAGKLLALDSFTMNGESFCQWTECPLSPKRLMQWLGY